MSLGERSSSSVWNSATRFWVSSQSKFKPSSSYFKVDSGRKLLNSKVKIMYGPNFFGKKCTWNPNSRISIVPHISQMLEYLWQKCWKGPLFPKHYLKRLFLVQRIFVHQFIYTYDQAKDHLSQEGHPPKVNMRYA